MKSADRENDRYREADHCEVRAEEKIIFNYLREIRKQKTGPLRLMDLGCGSGLISAKIKELGFMVTGIDFSTVAVAKARQNGIDAKVGDLDQGIPEADKRYDLVVAGDLIEHVFDPISLLKEMNRVLKDDGYLIFSVPHDWSVMVRLRALIGRSYQEINYFRTGSCKHHTSFSNRLLKFMLRQSNFRVVGQYRITNIGHLKQVTSLWLPLLFTNEFVIKAEKIV